MKILIVAEFFPTGNDLKFSGGVEARNLFVAKHLAKRHQVSILAARVPQSPLIERMFGFTVFRVGPIRQYQASIGDIPSRIIFVKDAINFGKTLNVDIVEGTNFITHSVARIIAIFKKIPAVAWYPDVWLGSWIKISGPTGFLGEILERINLLLGFDAFLAISKTTARKLIPYAKSKIYTIPCGVDIEEFKSSAKKANNPTIICISRLTKYKSIATLILAFALLSLKVKKASLLIIGTGPDRKNLQNLAKNLKIDKKVKFLSNLPRKQLIILLKSSHIFVLPSKVEGFGITTVEAAAAQTPYVVSNIETLKEVTHNGLGGLLFRTEDPMDLYKKILNLLTSKQLYKKKQKDGLVLANKYQWSAIAQKTEQIYKDLL